MGLVWSFGWRLMLAVAGVGGMLVWCGVNDILALQRAGGGPRSFRLAALEKEEPGVRGFVELTAFDADDWLVYTSAEDTSGHSFLIPAYPFHLNTRPAPENIRTLLELRNADEGDLRDVLRREVVPGEVTTPADALPPYVQTQLAERYPGMDLARCRIVRVGIRIPAWPWALLALSSGLTLLGAGVGMVLFKARQRQERAAMDQAFLEGSPALPPNTDGRAPRYSGRR